MFEKWDRKEKLMVFGTVLTLLSVLVSGAFIWVQLRQSNAQLRQSNALTWKAALENQSNELARLEVVSPAISCVYQWNDKAIDNECTVLLRKPSHRRRALMYTSQVLQFFAQINAFSNENDKQYANDFKQWIDEVANLDITSYFLILNEIDANQALKEFGIELNDNDIKKGDLRFKQRIGLKPKEYRDGGNR